MHTFWAVAEIMKPACACINPTRYYNKRTMVDLAPMLPIEVQAEYAARYAIGQITPDITSMRYTHRVIYQRARAHLQDEMPVGIRSTFKVAQNEVVSYEVGDIPNMLDALEAVIGERPSWMYDTDYIVEHEGDHGEAAIGARASACLYGASVSYGLERKHGSSRYTPTDGRRPYISRVFTRYIADHPMPVIAAASVTVRPQEPSNADLTLLQRFGYKNPRELDARILLWNEVNPDYQLLRPRSCIED